MEKGADQAGFGGLSSLNLPTSTSIDAVFNEKLLENRHLRTLQDGPGHSIKGKWGRTRVPKITNMSE